MFLIEETFSQDNYWLIKEFKLNKICSKIDLRMCQICFKCLTSIKNWGADINLYVLRRFFFRFFSFHYGIVLRILLFVIVIIDRSRNISVTNTKSITTFPNEKKKKRRQLFCYFLETTVLFLGRSVRGSFRLSFCYRVWSRGTR